MRKFIVRTLVFSLAALPCISMQGDEFDPKPILNQLSQMEASAQKQKGKPQTQAQQSQAQAQKPQAQAQQTQAQTQQTQAQTQQSQAQQTQAQAQKPQAQTQQTQSQAQKPQTQAQQTQSQAQKPQTQAQQSQAQAQQTQAQQTQKPQEQAQQTQAQTQNPIGPKWTVGQQWAVETQNTQSQNADSGTKPAPIKWLFKVIGEVQLNKQLCYQVKISCLENGINQPFVYIWVEKASGMLVRMTTYTFIKGSWQEYTETYQSKGKSTAVFGTVPSLPLDMPIFGSTGAKDVEPGVYETISNAGGRKAIGEVGFVNRVNQSMQPISEERSKSLQSSKAKGLEKISLDGAVEIDLKNGASPSVKQVWTPNTPWPIFSSNGTCESRLIDIPVETPKE